MTPAATDQPWLDRYDEGVPPTLAPSGDSVVAAFRRAVQNSPEHIAIRYFDAQMTVGELDQASNALACALEEGGFSKGDRLAVFLQNIPQFVIASLAAWKLNGVVVTVNPMYQSRELHEILSDSKPRILICHADEKLAMVRTTAALAGVQRLLTCDARAYQSRNDARVLGKPAGDLQDLHDLQAGLSETASGQNIPTVEHFEELVAQYAGRVPRHIATPAGTDTATLIYTSGTTGPAKGVASTHANMAQSVEVYKHWVPLTAADVILAIAPLVHVTGMLAYLAPALWLPATLVLTYRFEPTVFRDAVIESGATFTIGPTTVFVGLLNSAEVAGSDLRSLSKVYSGGSPMPAAVVDRFQEKFGFRILGIYGMTEATGPTHMTPREQRAPVDTATGTLAVGVPVSDTHVQVLDDAQRPVPAGEFGEFAIAGPQLGAGYLNKPGETAAAFSTHGFLTGDIGFMDAQGWFYIVDRKKDQINASGFKVWPREVEDVLYEHPAVVECAVVGLPDSYRGEDVGAFIVLRAGAHASREEIRDFCSERLARYKVPGIVRFVATLPRTASGKILRRELPGLVST